MLARALWAFGQSLLEFSDRLRSLVPQNYPMTDWLIHMTRNPHSCGGE